MASVRLLLGRRAPAAGWGLLQLLAGSGPGSSAWVQGSRPQRCPQPCLPGALAPQTRLLPAFLPLNFALPPSVPPSWQADCNPNLLLTSTLQLSVSPSKLNITHGDEGPLGSAGPGGGPARGSAGWGPMPGRGHEACLRRLWGRWVQGWAAGWAACPSAPVPPASGPALGGRLFT